jgi:lipopolysaccharide transport system ATP-binding protein
MTSQGELIFTSFDTDDEQRFERFSVRSAGHYLSRCTIPPDFLNEGRYLLGINASTFRVRRYFQDENALTFNVDATGAPGMHWTEQRLGVIRPRLNWQIEEKI